MVPQRKSNARTSVQQGEMIPAAVVPAVGPTANELLNAQYKRFVFENDPALKNKAGQDLIRSVFGADAIAEAP
jgi:hypothetical protein